MTHLASPDGHRLASPISFVSLPRMTVHFRVSSTFRYKSFWTVTTISPDRCPNRTQSYLPFSTAGSHCSVSSTSTEINYHNPIPNLGMQLNRWLRQVLVRA